MGNKVPTFYTQFFANTSENFKVFWEAAMSLQSCKEYLEEDQKKMANELREGVDKLRTMFVGKLSGVSGAIERLLSITQGKCQLEDNELREAFEVSFNVVCEFVEELVDTIQPSFNDLTEKCNTLLNSLEKSLNAIDNDKKNQKIANAKKYLKITVGCLVIVAGGLGAIVGVCLFFTGFGTFTGLQDMVKKSTMTGFDFIRSGMNQPLTQVDLDNLYKEAEKTYKDIRSLKETMLQMNKVIENVKANSKTCQGWYDKEIIAPLNKAFKDMQGDCNLLRQIVENLPVYKCN